MPPPLLFPASYFYRSFQIRRGGFRPVMVRFNWTWVAFSIKPRWGEWSLEDMCRSLDGRMMETETTPAWSRYRNTLFISCFVTFQSICLWITHQHGPSWWFFYFFYCPKIPKYPSQHRKFETHTSTKHSHLSESDLVMSPEFPVKLWHFYIKCCSWNKLWKCKFMTDFTNWFSESLKCKLR